MKKWILVTMLCIGLTIVPTKESNAIVWVVIQEAVKKAIKAIDLQIQRLQNKTIWLQNAQKTLENTMSKLQLDEITDWVDKHREQYTNYFDELHKVREAINGFNKVKDIMQKQVALVEEYKSTFNLFKKDVHFNSSEISYMLKVYTGIVNESLKNLDLLLLATTEFSTVMTDGKRLAIVNSVSEKINENLNDLRLFNTQNIKLSLQRSKDAREVEQVKLLYGI